MRENQEEEVIRLHENLNHRRNIYDLLRKNETNIKLTKAKEIIDSCMTCKRKDVKIGKSCNYVLTERPGEKIGVDLLEISKKERVIVAIDYFSRKIFDRLIK